MRRCLLSPCFPMQFMKDCSDDVAEIQRRGPQYGNVDMANHRWAGNDHGYGWEFAMSKRINVQSTHGKFAKLRVSAETSAAAFGWELHWRCGQLMQLMLPFEKRAKNNLGRPL